MKNLCNWLGLEYFPGMLQQHENAANYISGDWHLHKMVAKPIDASRAYVWKKQLSKRQIADFESVAGDLLQRFDYEIIGAKVPFYLRAARVVREKIKSSLKNNAPGVLKQLGIN